MKFSLQLILNGLLRLRPYDLETKFVSARSMTYYTLNILSFDTKYLSNVGVEERGWWVTHTFQ